MAMMVKDVKDGISRVKRSVLGMAQVNAVNLNAYFRARDIPVGNMQPGDNMQK